MISLFNLETNRNLLLIVFEKYKKLFIQGDYDIKKV